MPSIEKAPDKPLRDLPGDPRPLANERGIRTCSSTFENSTRPFGAPLFADTSRPHALLRLLQRIFQRARSRTTRTSQMHDERDAGTIAISDPSLPLDRGQPPRLLEVRGRGSPNPGILFRDCSQKSLRPNLDRLRLLVSRGSFPKSVWSDVNEEQARQRYPACKARPAKGP